MTRTSHRPKRSHWASAVHSNDQSSSASVGSAPPPPTQPPPPPRPPPPRPSPRKQQPAQRNHGGNDAWGPPRHHVRNGGDANDDRPSRSIRSVRPTADRTGTSVLGHDEHWYSDGRHNIYRADPSYRQFDGRSRGAHQDDRMPERHEGKRDRMPDRHEKRGALKRPPGNQLSQEEERRRRQRSGSSYTLECRPLKDAEQPQELWWRCEVDPIPIATELILVEALLPNKARERGMMREKSKSFLHRIKGLCKQHGVDISTACSLRRHHIKKYNIGRCMSSLRLGNEADIKASAAIFEAEVATFLRRERIDCYDENEQRVFINANLPQGKPYPGTPDFILKQPLLLKTYRQKELKLEDGTTEFQRGDVTDELLIHWIEVKMFYGASTIKRDGKSAVGRILQMAEKYTNSHGAGAVIFMQGFGDVLGQQLRGMGVMALGCCPAVNFKPKLVTRHQRTWCATDGGEILP